MSATRELKSGGGRCNCACGQNQENEVEVCPCLVQSISPDGVSTLTCPCVGPEEQQQRNCACQRPGPIEDQLSINGGGEVDEGSGTTTDEDEDVFMNRVFEEYLNMPLDSKLSKSLLAKKEFTRLTLRPVLAAKLVVNKRGFLPGENLTFTLTFKNCTKNIVKLAVALIQKHIVLDHLEKDVFVCKWNGCGHDAIKYFNLCRHISNHLDWWPYICQVKYIAKDGGTSKATTAVLVQKKLVSTDPKFQMKDGKICWASGFPIPTFIMPSLTRESKKSVEITYSIQYALESQGKPWAGVVSGEAPIVIGTTRKGFSLIPEGHSFTDSPRGSSSTMHSLGSLSSLSPSTQENTDKPKFRRISLMLIPEKEETTYGILKLKMDNHNHDGVPVGKKRNRTLSHNE